MGLHPNSTHEAPRIKCLVKEDHCRSNNTSGLSIDGDHRSQDSHHHGHANGCKHEGNTPAKLFDGVPSSERGDQEPHLQNARQEQGGMVGQPHRVLETAGNS